MLVSLKIAHPDGWKYLAHDITLNYRPIRWDSHHARIVTYALQGSTQDIYYRTAVTVESGHQREQVNVIDERAGKNTLEEAHRAGLRFFLDQYCVKCPRSK